MRLHVYHLCQRSRVYSTSLQLTLLTNQDMTHIQLWRYYVYGLWNTIWAQVTIASVDLNQRRFWRRLQQPFIEYSEQKYNVYIELVAKPSERTLQQSSRINCPLICLKEAYSAVRKLQVNLDYFVKAWKIFLFISKIRTAMLVDRNHSGETCSCFHKALRVIIVSPCKKSTRTVVCSCFLSKFKLPYTTHLFWGETVMICK